MIQAYVNTAALGSIERFLGTGATTMAAPVPGCVRADDEKITKIRGEMVLTPAMIAAMEYLRFDVPTIAVPGLAAGDIVTLKVTLKRGRLKHLDRISDYGAHSFFPVFGGKL